MRQSYLSASMAPSWISTYGPDKRSPKAGTILSIDNRDFLIRKQQQRRSTRKPTKSINGSRPFTKRITSPEVIMRRRKRNFLVRQIQLRDRRQRPKRYPSERPLRRYIQNIHIEPFQDVKATEPILTFIELDRLKIETYIPEEVALHLYDKEKQKLCQIGIHFDTAPERTITLPIYMCLKVRQTITSLIYWPPLSPTPIWNGWAEWVESSRSTYPKKSGLKIYGFP